jgi:subtilisin-like proprotein convertase family protein
VNAALQIVCNTYQSGVLNDPIPDNSRIGSLSTINVPLTDNVASIKVGVDITHTYIQDLVIGISDPLDNNFALVWNRECANQDDLNATFEDGAAAILCGQPTVGNFSPSNSFTIFENIQANGNWEIRVSDNAGQDTGTFNNWSIEICTILVTPLSNDSFELDNLSIYPNPNNGSFNILFDNVSSNQVAITVFDLSGRSVFKNSYETFSRFNQNIHLQSVTSGMYLVNIIDGNRVVTKKIVIK